MCHIFCHNSYGGLCLQGHWHMVVHYLISYGKVCHFDAIVDIWTIPNLYPWYAFQETLVLDAAHYARFTIIHQFGNSHFIESIEHSQ